MSERVKLLQIGPETAPLWNLADWRDPVLFAGVNFLPWGFAVRRQKTGVINQTGATIALQNSDNTLVNYGKTTGLTGVECTLTYATLENGTWIEDPDYSQMILPIGEFYGQYPVVTIELSASYGWSRTPGIPMGDKHCRHILKGLRCQYVGPDTTCLRTREHCRLVKNNLRHYGGLHWGVEPGATFDLGPAQPTMPDSPIGGRTYPPRLGGDSGTGVEGAPAPPPEIHPHFPPVM